MTGDTGEPILGGDFIRSETVPEGSANGATTWEYSFSATAGNYSAGGEVPDSDLTFQGIHLIADEPLPEMRAEFFWFSLTPFSYQGFEILPTERVSLPTTVEIASATVPERSSWVIFSFLTVGMVGMRRRFRAMSLSAPS